MLLSSIRSSVSSSASIRAFSTSATYSSFAKLVVLGRLGSPPEVQATSTGREILKFSVATTSGRGESEKTNWFRIKSFIEDGPRKDLIVGLEKGTLLYVEAEATMEQYQDSQGQTRSSLNLIESMFYNTYPQLPVATKNLPEKLEILSRKPSTPAS